jgi:hypothetical protein
MVAIDSVAMSGNARIMFWIVAHVAARALDCVHQGSPFGRKVERFRAFGRKFQFASAGPKLVALRP